MAATTTRKAPATDAMLQKVGALFLFGLLAFASDQAHRARLAVPAPSGTQTAWPAAGRRALCGTYWPIVADVYYLRAVNAFGNKAEHRQNYPSLWPLLQRSLFFDPQFAAPYLLAGTVLGPAQLSRPQLLDVMAQGARRRPDVWRLLFLYGFLLMDEGRYAEAARAIGDASALPDAPPHLRPLSTRLAAEGGAPDVGLAMIDAWLSHTQSDEERQALLSRRALLQFEQTIAAWQRAAQAFAQARHRPPRDCDEAAAYSPTPLPCDDPWGAPMRIDAHGEVQSEHMPRRLRLHKQGEATRPANTL